MPSVTYLNTDGEIARFGGRANRNTAVIFYDRSASAMVYGAPCGGSFGFDIGATRVMTITQGGANFNQPIVFNECSADYDYRFEGANNANLLVLDGGTDSIGIGGAVVTGALFAVTPADVERDIVTAVGHVLHIPADTACVNAAGNCETVALGSAVRIGTPTWSSTGTGFTVTDAASFYVQAAPAAGCNVTLTRSYAVFVDGGTSRFDGTVQLGLAGTAGGVLNFQGSASGVVTVQGAACAGTYTLTLPTNDGCCGQQLTTNGSGVLSWAAASWGSDKNIQGHVCKNAAFDRIRNLNIYDYTYKDNGRAGQWTAGGAQMTGPLAEEAPWAMQGAKRGAFSAINSFGNLTAAFQVLADKVEALEAQVA